MVARREEDFDLIGLAEDALEASVQVFYVRKGRVVGRKGLIVDKVEDVEPPALDRPHRRAALRRRAAGRHPQGDPRPGRARGPRALRGVPRAERAARRCASACRSAATSASCSRPRRSTPSEAFARHKLRRASDHNARARAARRAAGGARPARGAAAHRVLRHLHLQGTEIVGSMVVMEDGLPEALRLPPVQGPRPRRARRLRRRWKRCSPAGFRNYLRERDEGAQAGQAVRVPAEPAADRRRQGPARRRGARARGARPREDICVASPRQAVRGGLPARRSRPGAHPPRLRGAVPAAAGARRGPPLRDHVPPRSCATRR